MSPRKVVKSGRHRKKKNSQSSQQDVEMEGKYDFESNPTSYFLNITSFDDHMEAQTNFRKRYIATIVKLVGMKIEILPSAKVKALVCAWSRKDQEMARGLLSMKKIFNFVEVAKAVNILDIPRQIKALEKKKLTLLGLREAKRSMVKDATLKRLDRKITMLNTQKLKFGSVSGALSQHIRHWIRNFDQEELKFMAMNFETAMWRELADKVHFNPGLDFTPLPWFLPYCYGQAAPPDSTVNRVGSVTKDNINEVLSSCPLPFHKISKFKDVLTDESKAIVALHDDNVGRAIWWYEDLECPRVNDIILQRLHTENNVDFGYGKLMERLILLKPKNVAFYPHLMEIAERKLKEYRHNLIGPIGVFADASGSMEVAIKIATIVSSFLTVFTNAKLVFFNHEYMMPPKNPDSISDVIDMALNTRAENATAPAAALWPFYASKERLKTIIMVTDEEENTAYEGHMFADLYEKYVAEVGACGLIFISFLNNQHSKGQMVEQLRARGVPATQHILCSHRPDISKLDSIIGKMSLNTASFVEVIGTIETAIDRDGVQTLFDNIGL